MTDFIPERDKHEASYCLDTNSGMHCSFHEDELHREVTTPEKEWEDRIIQEFGSHHWLMEFIRETLQKRDEFWEAQEMAVADDCFEHEKKARLEAYEEGKKDGAEEYEKGLEEIKEIAQGMRDDQKEFGAFLSKAARNLPE